MKVEQLVREDNKLASKVLLGLIFSSAGLAILTEQLGVFSAFVVLKPITTILVISLLFSRNFRPLEHYPKLILVGLCFCLAGDTFLLYEKFFVYGLSAFLIGHLFFLRAFSILGGFKFYLIPLLVLVLLTLPIFIWLLPSLGENTIAVAIYMLVLVSMVWQGLCLWQWRSTAFSKAVAVAGVAFMFSDTVIAINKFMLPLPFLQIVILVSYWFSITLLAYSSSQWALMNE